MSSGVLTLINWHEQIHIWVSYVSSRAIECWTVALKILKWSAARLPDFTAYPLGWLEPKAFAKKNTLGSLGSWACSQIIRDPGSVPFFSQRSYPFPSYKVLCRGDCSCWRQSSSNSYAGFLDMACQIIIMWRVMCPCCFLWRKPLYTCWISNQHDSNFDNSCVTLIISTNSIQILPLL